MTTIREDQSSWRYDGLMVRDARHTHNGPEVPRYRKKAPKKKTCKHKAPHAFTKLVKEYNWSWLRRVGEMPTRVMACEVCGKQKWF